MLEAVFTSGVDEITVPGLTQWDTGQQLKITVEGIPAAFEVHFARKRSDEAAVVEVTSSNGSAVVNIPNELLRHPCDAVAYVYYVDGEAGETVKTINLPLKKRVKPADYIYEEDDILNFEKMLIRTRAILDDAEKTANEAVEAAEEAENNAKNAEIAARNDANLANNALTGVKAIVAGNEAYTKYESDRKYAANITCKASGDVVTVEDSSEAPLQGLKLFGKTEQVTTTGKNLLDISGAAVNTLKGVSFDFMDDGTVIATGTPTEVFAASIYGSYAVPVSFPAGDYIVSGGVDTNHYIRVRVHTSDGTLKSQHYDYNDSRFFTVEDGDLISVTIYFATLTAVSAIKFSPMIRLATVEDSTYEPYTGGKASPCPEYPQEIEGVHGSRVMVYGKNLLKNIAATSTSNGITFTVNTDGSVTVDGTATAGAWLNVSGRFALPKGTYILSGCPDGGVYGSTYVLSATTAADYGNTKTFTLEEETEITVNIGVYAGCTVNNLTFYPMIRLATVEDSTYEPYKEEQFVSIPYALHGIPVSSGGNYADASGQQWICDEVDMERGVYVQRIGSYTVTGEEGWYLSGLQNLASEGIYRYDTNYVSSHSSALSNAMSTHYPFPEKINLEKGCWVLNDATQYLALRIMWKYSTVEELKTFLQEQYRQNTPVVVNYVYATPIETALSEKELEMYREIHTNFPNTTILNDSGAWMEVEYNADTKTFVMNCQKPATDEQIETAVTAYLKENPVSVDPVTLTDASTNKRYQLYVTGGELKMKEVTV